MLSLEKVENLQTIKCKYKKNISMYVKIILSKLIYVNEFLPFTELPCFMLKYYHIPILRLCAM